MASPNQQHHHDSNGSSSATLLLPGGLATLAKADPRGAARAVRALRSGRAQLRRFVAASSRHRTLAEVLHQQQASEGDVAHNTSFAATTATATASSTLGLSALQTSNGSGGATLYRSTLGASTMHASMASRSRRLAHAAAHRGSRQALSFSDYYGASATPQDMALLSRPHVGTTTAVSPGHDSGQAASSSFWGGPSPRSPDRNTATANDTTSHASIAQAAATAAARVRMYRSAGGPGAAPAAAAAASSSTTLSNDLVDILGTSSSAAPFKSEALSTQVLLQAAAQQLETRERESAAAGHGGSGRVASSPATSPTRSPTRVPPPLHRVRTEASVLSSLATVAEESDGDGVGDDGLLEGTGAVSTLDGALGEVDDSNERELQQIFRLLGQLTCVKGLGPRFVRVLTLATTSELGGSCDEKQV